MAVQDRIQLARRRDPYPWTWEPFVGWILGLLAVLVLGVHLGRAVANLIAGAGWTWPQADQVVLSIIKVIGGDAAAGLAHPVASQMAGTGLLAWSLILTEIAVVGGYVWATVWMLRTWGPWRVLGMASREEAERLLGRTRLRKVAHVVRPDLYNGKADTAAPVSKNVIYLDDEATDSPLGRGLSPRFLPTRTTLTWRGRETGTASQPSSQPTNQQNRKGRR